MTAQRGTNRRSRARGTTSTKCQHRATQRFCAECFKRPPTGIDTIDDNCGESFSDGGFERCLPTWIDVDEIENGSKNAIDTSKSFGTGTRTSLVER